MPIKHQPFTPSELTLHPIKAATRIQTGPIFTLNTVFVIQTLKTQSLQLESETEGIIVALPRTRKAAPVTGLEVLQ